MFTVAVRADVKALVRPVARGPGVRERGAGGAGEGVREWCTVAIGEISTD